MLKMFEQIKKRLLERNVRKDFGRSTLRFLFLIFIEVSVKHVKFTLT